MLTTKDTKMHEVRRFESSETFVYLRGEFMSSAHV